MGGGNRFGLDGGDVDGGYRFGLGGGDVFDGGYGAAGIELPFGEDFRHRHGVGDVRLAVHAELAAVRALGKPVGALERRDVGICQVSDAGGNG